MHEALSSGARIPDDLAIVGFDDIEEAQFHTPTLTSVRPNKRRIARLVVERLAARLDAGDAHLPEVIYADYELIRRQSTLGSTR